MDLDQLATRFDANHTETKGLLQTQKSAIDGMGARVHDLEQKVSRRGNAGAPMETKSVGAQVAQSDDLRSYITNGMKGRVRIEVKNLTSAGTAGSLVPPDRQGDVTLLPQRPLRVKDLLRPGRTTSGIVQVMRQTTRTIAAATVAEGALKPQSDLGFELVNYPVQTIAHWVRASKQILADAPVLQATIESELLYGLEYVEDQQLLNGDGLGTNLLGLIPQATAFDTSGHATTDTLIDTVRRAFLQTRLALYPATGIIMNPTDWATIELTKDTQGRYIFGDPSTGRPAAMWGRPVAETEAMPAGNFLAGAFGLAAQVFDREEDQVFISTEDGSNFVTNMVTVLAEERMALAVRAPRAMIYGAF